MTYYIFLQDGKLNGAGQCPILNEEIQNIEVTEDIYNAIAENPEKYIYSGGEIIENPAYEAEQQAKEEERINQLTMTALDFITFLQNAGLTLEQINAYLDSNLEVKMQLTYCQNVYCGVAKKLMPITVDGITITADMIEIAFKIKNGERLEDENTADTAE